MRMIAQYCRRAVLRACGSELEGKVAYAIGEELAARGGRAEVATVALRAICAQRGVLSEWAHAKGHAPAYGTITRVLDILRAVGVVSWSKAHVLRYCPDRRRNDKGELVCDHQWEVNRPRKHADGSFRLPIRKLAFVGFAATLVATAPALAANSIDTADRANQPAMRSSEVEKPGTVQTAPVLLSSESAPEADRDRSPPGPFRSVVARALARAGLDRLIPDD